MMDEAKRDWPDSAIAAVAKAIDGWNAERLTQSVVRIVWGYPSRDEEVEEEEFPGELRQPEALLEYCESNFEVLLSASGDPDFADSCLITSRFDTRPDI